MTEGFYNKSFLMARSPGYKGIEETVVVMAELINNYKKNLDVRKKAIEIVGNSRSIKDQAEKIFNWIKKNINYVRDIYFVETLQTPVQTMKIKAGDCDDFSILAGSLLESIGIPVDIVVAGYGKKPDFRHVFLNIYFKGQRIAFDPTMKNKMGLRSSNATHFIIYKKRG